MDLDRILPPTLAAQLPVAPPEVRAAVELVASDEPAGRMTGIDALAETLWRRGQLGPDAAEAVPYVIALAIGPGLREGAALLMRLARVLAAIDDPPRSLSGEAGTLVQRQVYDRIEAEVPRLLRLATLGRDPVRARLAACLAARFPAHDGQVESVLLALLSGTDDDDERARLLYALTRVQASRGAALHRHIAEALAQGPSDPCRFAVLLALASHDPDEPLRSRCANALRQALSEPRTDPRAFGRQLATSSVQAALAALVG